MKSIITLFILLMATSSFAQSLYVPESKVGKGTDGLTIHKSKAKCETQYSETCFDIKSTKNASYSEIIDEMVDDYSKPVNSKNEIEACSDQTDCETKNASKVCADSEESVFMAADYSEIYCSKLLRFEQKLSGRKIVSANETSKASYDAAKIAEATKEAAIAMAARAIACGKRVISMLVVQNASKSLDTTQIKAMNVTYASIKDLLETGSLTSAREEILAQPVAEPLVTQTDKDVLVAELDACKPQ